MSKRLSWWKASSDELAAAVSGLLTEVKGRQQARLQSYRRWSMLYGADPLALGWRTAASGMYEIERIAFNQAASIIDSLAAKIIKNRPLPQVTTEGASYSKRKRAQRLSRFIEGQFYDCKLYEVGASCVVDTLVFGTGCVKLWVEGDSIRVARVFPYDLRVLDGESRYATPRQLWHIDWYDRGVLSDLYPEFEEQIKEAPEPDKRDDIYQYDDAQDRVEVREGWHLPSGPDADDGRHVLCLDQTVLLDEEWTRDEFPFCFLRRKPALVGFWGQSLMQDLAPGQMEYDALCERIQRAHRLLGGAHMIVQRGSKINLSELDNDIGTIISCDGPPPTEWTPTPVNPDTYRYTESIAARMREVSGQSAMSVHSEKPGGVTSGIALQTLDDVESERFMAFHRAYEQWFVDIARQMIVLSDIVPNARVKTKTSRGVEVLHWADVSLPEDETIVEIFPTSLLAKTPGARLEQLQELLAGGVIDTVRFRQLFQMPDVERDNELDAAVLDVVDRAFDKIILDGEFEGPESFDDLQRCLERALKLYAHARTYTDIKPERLEMCRRYIELCQRKLAESQAPAVPPEAGPGMAPPPEGMTPQ